MPTNLHEALVEEIRDIYNAEKQIVKALPKIVKCASSDELRDALESHFEETENQVTRLERVFELLDEKPRGKHLERVFELLDEKPRGKHCAGMAGILEEGNQTLQEDAEGALMDAMLIAGAQRVEHYEITAYGTAIAWAEALELTEVAQLLGETLAEETAADEKLSAIAESGINEAATVGESEEEIDEDDQDTADVRPDQGAEAGATVRSATGAGKTTRQRGGRR